MSKPQSRWVLDPELAARVQAPSPDRAGRALETHLMVSAWGLWVWGDLSHSNTALTRKPR